MDSKTYVLITPARNEETYVEKTIQSVISQTILPHKWVIVSDGSTDSTDEIVGRYLQQFDFIQLLRITDNSQRNFASQVYAINSGYEQLKHLEYNFIGNLDADISFDSDYYERVFQKFQEHPKMGIGGGFIYESYNGKWKSRRFNTIGSVAHAIQLFRRECYEAIGGYIPLPHGGADWCAEVMARMNGWQVESFPELRVFHRRPTLTAEGILQGHFRQGLMDFSMGSHPIFEILKCLRRIKGKPLLAGAFLRMGGFIWAWCQREKRIVPPEFVDYLRMEEMARVQSLFWKKSKNEY